MDKPLTDEELNIAMAEKVMGWKPWVSPMVPKGDTVPDCWRTGDPRNPTWRIGGWKPATDIAVAWIVVEKMCEKGLRFDLTFAPALDDWCADFGGKPEGNYNVYARTAPEAICLAALKAVKSEEKHE